MRISLLAFLIILGSLPFKANACSCSPGSLIGKPLSAYSSAKSIFLGKVTEIKSIKKNGKSFRQITYEVTENFKNTNQKTISILSGKHMCGTNAQLGHSYIQYAYDNAEKNNVCNGSMSASSGLAPQALKRLRFLKSQSQLKKVECEKKKGQWLGEFKATKNPRCFLPTPDKGKSCKSSNDCISHCVSQLTTDKFEKYKDCNDGFCEIKFSPVKASGTCYGSTRLTGTCLSFVNAGWASAPLCID